MAYLAAASAGAARARSQGWFSDIVLKVSREDIVAERLQSTIDTIADALRQADIRYTGLSGEAGRVCSFVSAMQ